MRYLQTTKHVALSIPATITETTEDDATGVLITLDIRAFKKGYSLDLLHAVIEEAAIAANLSSYRIHHDAKGLVLTGKMKK